MLVLNGLFELTRSMLVAGADCVREKSLPCSSDLSNPGVSNELEKCSVLFSLDLTFGEV